jgi:ectoine hydroxylase-related dioxygenase (phytanoyl-CoA dioxygenase family)
MTNMSATSNADVEFYWANGWLVLRGLFTQDDVQSWRAACDRLLGRADLIHEDNLRTRFRKGNEGVWRLEKFDPVVDISDEFRALSKDERLLAPLRGIFHGAEPLLFKDKLIFKPGGHSGFKIHQDFSSYQPFPADTICSAMIAIDGADGENGALELYSGYHHRLYASDISLRSWPEELIKQEIDMSRMVRVDTEPGDVILFHSLAPHSSGHNKSTQSRRHLYLTYNSATAGDLYAAQYDHYRWYMDQRLSEADKRRLYFE